MKMLVLGGTRFIGRRLVEVLLDSGHEVTLFNRGRTPDDFTSQVRRLEGDRQSPADLKTAIGTGSYDAVFDLLCYDAADAMVAVEALSGKTGRLVHVSTCSVYWCTGDFPCPVGEEEFDRHGEFPEQPESIEYDYGYAKRQAEKVLMEAHAKGRLSVSIVRPPVVSGAADPSLRYAGYCERIGDGDPVVVPDGGKARLRHVWVDDLARIMAVLPSKPAAAGRAYNLASEEEISVGRIVTEIATIMGSSPELIDIPGEYLEREGGRGLTTAISPFTQARSQVPDIMRARKELGWSPAPWEVWVRETVRWWLDEGRSTGAVPPAIAHRRQELELVRSHRAGR